MAEHRCLLLQNAEVSRRPKAIERLPAFEVWSNDRGACQPSDVKRTATKKLPTRLRTCSLGVAPS